MTPKVNGIEAMRKQLALSVYGSVNEKDVADMMAKLKEMALAGDLNAMKQWFKMTVGEPEKTSSAPQEPAGVSQLADAVQDLVDEIRIAKAAPPRSKPKAIGSDEDDDDE